MSRYTVEMTSKTIDFYDIWDAYHEGKPHKLGDSAIQHAVKKLLIPGERHAKTRVEDIDEAIASLLRAKQQLEWEEDND